MTKLFEADAVLPQPWRNGGGVTRELLAWPDGADWRLRLSLADIERDGPFSAFPGVQRHFAVIAGAGVALDFGAGEQRLCVGDPPLAFDGTLAPGCRLLAGPTRDLNLMLRELRGAMQLVLPGRWFAGRGWSALFSPCAGQLQAGDGRYWPMPPLALLADLPSTALCWRGERPAYWIQVER